MLCIFSDQSRTLHSLKGSKRSSVGLQLDFCPEVSIRLTECRSVHFSGDPTRHVLRGPGNAGQRTFLLTTNFSRNRMSRAKGFRGFQGTQRSRLWAHRAWVESYTLVHTGTCGGKLWPKVFTIEGFVKEHYNSV